ncbi:MAG: winged helix DNA-binding domain-containing protein [Ilumatobacteraceae bacterium]
MLRVTDAHRRARIARRHGLNPDHRYCSIEAATTAMTALHATEPATPHLALRARVREISVEDVEAALYDTRSLVKPMAMRRTLFVVTRGLLPAVVGSAGRRVAEAERRRLAKETGALQEQLGADWIAAASDQIVDRLTGTELSARALRDTLPHLGGTFTAAPGTKWSAEVWTMSRLLTILAAAGVVVRGHNAGHWRISRPMWTSMADWLGEEMTPTASERGYAEVVRHWLWTFGPGTEADLVWWLGATKTAVRRALSDVEAVPVMLESGSTGWVLPADTADLEVPAEIEPWVALLPTLDPTTMGWRDRAFYLDGVHTPHLFDSAGNAGTTVWVNGRIVGCWVQDDAERVRPVLVAEISRGAQRLLDVEAARLDEFLRGEHITNVYASPMTKRQRIG